MTAANERADREEPKEKAYVAVIAYIKQLVQDGQLSFGGKLPSERDMMATLSLGRNSIREALRTLENMGLLSCVHGKGNYLVNRIGESFSGVFSLLLFLKQSDFEEVQQLRRERGLKADSPSMHMIFTGNPGTGKTTVARIVSRYLKAIGALQGGQLVEVTRADLVGQYVGHTAPLTQKAIQSALGGVLFIDEAYSLYRGKDDSFGLEAIDTLVKGMEDHRDDLVVILAGYSREMEEFLTANSGLRSRFPNIIEFPDYTAGELVEITKSIVASKGYRLAPACEIPLLAYYQRQQQEGDPRTNGNGRMARNKVEEAVIACSRRNVRTPEAQRDLELLLPEDFGF